MIILRAVLIKVSSEGYGMWKANLSTWLVALTFCVSPLSVMAADKVTIWIDFQAGFRGETVELVINDKEVLRKKIVSNPTTGFAFHLEKKVMPGVSNIVLLVNEKRAFGQKVVVEGDMFIGFGLFDDRSAYLTISQKPFLYD